jgi:hypothetical protein
LDANSLIKYLSIWYFSLDLSCSDLPILSYRPTYLHRPQYLSLPLQSVYTYIYIISYILCKFADSHPGPFNRLTQPSTSIIIHYHPKCRPANEVPTKNIQQANESCWSHYALFFCAPPSTARTWVHLGRIGCWIFCFCHKQKHTPSNYVYIYKYIYITHTYVFMCIHMYSYVFICIHMNSYEFICIHDLREEGKHAILCHHPSSLQTPTRYHPISGITQKKQIPSTPSNQPPFHPSNSHYGKRLSTYHSNLQAYTNEPWPVSHHEHPLSH